MSLLRWRGRERIAPVIGDERVIRRFVLAKCLGGEWRMLGVERIRQRFSRYRVAPPEMRAMDVVGWLSVAWAD